MPEVLRYVGLANESSLNESPPPAAVVHVDAESASLDTPQNPYLIYEGGMGGRSVRTRRSGPYDPSGNIVFGVDVDTLPFWLRWALGNYAFTAGTPNIHEMWGTNDVDLPSFVTRLGKDAFEHIFSGCRLDSLELRVDRGFLTGTASVQAMVDSRTSMLAESSLLPPAPPPLAFHEIGVSIDGVDESADITSLRLLIANNLQRSGGMGSRFSKPRANQRDVTVEATARFVDEDHLVRFWGDVNGPSIDGGDDFPFIFSGTHVGFGAMTLLLPKAVIITQSLQPSGRQEMFQNLSMQGFRDAVTLEDASTVQSDLLATVTNGYSDVEATS